MIEQEKTDSEGHIEFRRCAKCGSSQMTPVSEYSDSGWGMRDSGLEYKCPQCDHNVNIRAGDSIASGAFYAIITGLIGWWAFLQGPYWYATNLSYFTASYYEASFIILDLLAFTFYSLLSAYGVWMIWRELVSPLLTRMRYRVVGENREKQEAEIASEAKSRRVRITSFFLFPFIVYIPLFGGIYVLDLLGFDVRENELFKFVGIAFIFAAAMALARKFKVEFGLVFFGMVFWMAATISIIFWLG